MGLTDVGASNMRIMLKLAQSIPLEGYSDRRADRADDPHDSRLAFLRLRLWLRNGPN
jgi:hypothetical protein